MGVYDRQIATALRVIREKGEACTWTAKAAPTTDPATPWLPVAGVAVAYTNTPIAFFPLSRQWSELLRYLKGTEVVTGSLYGLMPAVAFAPQLTDIITRTDGSKLAPITIDPLAPNGEIILYTIEFRK